jgi:catechol-2,3-dioxygenase
MTLVFLQRSSSMARTNHGPLKVADLEAATKFYENVLGFGKSGPGARAAIFPATLPTVMSILR